MIPLLNQSLSCITDQGNDGLFDIVGVHHLFFLALQRLWNDFEVLHVCYASNLLTRAGGQDA
jgi:hypothetical protein